jgi:hypothetical protein
MGLQNEIDEIRLEVRTDDYPMSIGEWISLYEDEEIDIHPEFQRFFRWTDTQKTRFIESILLGIPLPPIFVSQRKDGVWDVIDGLQRLSTIYQFAGILKNEKGTLIEPLELEKTKYLPSLERKKWNAEDDPENSFDINQRLFMKRSKMHVNIILRESNEFAKYEMFQRLNTGGSQLSDQEVRNCILVQINTAMFDWLKSLSQYDNFKECTLLNERGLEEQYDLELVLRFVILRSINEANMSGIGDLGDFLTDKMIETAQNKAYNYKEEEEAFKETFDILCKTIKENSFRRYDKSKDKFLGGFLLTPYEVVALGIGYNYRNAVSLKIQIEDRVKSFWTEIAPDLPMASGWRASSRIPVTISAGRKLFLK